LFLACQHLNSWKNLHEREDEIWFKVQAGPVFRFDVICFRIPQIEYHCFKVTDKREGGRIGMWLSLRIHSLGVVILS
jgi:hypothetical protein